MTLGPTPNPELDLKKEWIYYFGYKYEQKRFFDQLFLNDKIINISFINISINLND